MKFKTKLKVITKDNVKKLEDVVVGDLLKCEDGEFYPVKNVLTTSGNPFFYRLSNNVSFYLPVRATIKTVKEFKVPELWDEICVNSEVIPQIVQKTFINRIAFFNDILIEGNMVTPEGIVFKFRP